VYPALAVHSALKAADPDLETLWVGGEGGMEERLVERAGIPFKTIPAAGIHGVAIRQLPANISAIVRGIKSAAKILDNFKPDVLFFTGGYVAVPMALAGRSIPSVIFVPDIEPGMALKFLAFFASCVTVTADESRQFFSSKAKIVVTGYPVRKEILEWEKEEARKHFGIKNAVPVLLVYGGSKGAHSLNVALKEHLITLLEKVEVIHISGELDWSEIEEFIKTLTKQQADLYHAFPYLYEDMGAAFSAADLVVSRAGASSLGEFPQFGLPAILVPYPHAWRYQKVNASALTKRGAALMIEDAKLKSGLLLTIEKLLETPEKLDSMRSAMITLKSTNAASQIADQLIKLAGDKR